MGFRQDTRGASIALNHALSIGITALLISGLLLGAGNLLQRQEARVMQNGLEATSASVTNEVTSIDELAASGVSGNGEIRSTVDYPQQIAGKSYDIKLLVRPDGSTVVYANSSNPTLSIPVEFENETDICERGINGGPIEIVYDSTRDCITIRQTGT